MIAILLSLIVGFTAAPDTSKVTEAHWRVYDAQGQPSSLDAIVEAAASADVLYIGETHDDPVVHHLQQELLERIFRNEHARGVSLTMEMFTRDVQYIVDEYLRDLIRESHFLAASSPWPNYATDYRPLVEFSKVHGIPVVAANAPRRYVNRVTRLGRSALDDVSEQARSYLAPLPYGEASEAYTAEWNALMIEAMAQMTAAADSANAPDEDAAGAASEENESPATAGDSGEPGHGDGGDRAQEAEAPAMPAGPDHGSMAYMLDSQSLWDATMAWSIGLELMRRPGSVAVHVVGAFHVENHTGIPEHLARYRPGVRQVVVTVRPAADVTAFDEENTGLGDFVILSDESLPRTHQR